MGKLSPAEIDASARERASHYAPLPRWEPMTAGLVGALVSALPVIVFMGLARLDPDAFPGAMVVTIGLGFLAPFAYLKYQEREHHRAWSREYEALRASNDA